jgi:hypothetical protein
MGQIEDLRDDVERTHPVEIISGPLPTRRARLGLAMLVSSALFFGAASAARACESPASPSKAIKTSLERNGFTYRYSRCSRFGRAYYAFALNTADANHWTNRERVFIVTTTPMQALHAVDFYRSETGRAAFLAAFRTLVSKYNSNWRFAIRLTRASSVGRIVHLEAVARASPR